jgi:hypothetical protein
VRVAGSGHAGRNALTEPDEIVELPTPHGPARVQLHRVSTPRALLMLGHGAGGGVGAPDLGAATGAALELGVAVALVEQPYRVAGRRSPAPAKQLDAAWLAVAERLQDARPANGPLITGGRSSGARVACRTAAPAGASAVLCLAFPLQPPSRKKPAVSRLPELDEVTVPVLVVQGERDPFGMPPPAPGREVVSVRGNHSLRASTALVGEAVRAWLGAVSG